MTPETRTLLQNADDFINAFKKSENTPTIENKSYHKVKAEKKTGEAATIKSDKKPKPPVGNFSFGHREDQIFPEKQAPFKQRVITFVEVFYHQNGYLPTKSDFLTQFEHSELPSDQNGWQELVESLFNPLTARGIPHYEKPSNEYEPNFVLAVNLIVNAYDKRSVAAKLKDAGLTSHQWNGFLEDTAHYDYFKERLDNVFDKSTQLDAKVAVQRLVQNGDLQAIKYYHELQGTAPANNQNLTVILNTIMTILAAHVAPSIISKVAAEFTSALAIEAQAS